MAMPSSELNWYRLEWGVEVSGSGVQALPFQGLQRTTAARSSGEGEWARGRVGAGLGPLLRLEAAVRV